MPFFSIIIPIYNVEQYLRRCVDSVLAQTFTDFEVILIDDGSPDDSGKICDDYAASDLRVKVIHKENGGLSDARNAGMKQASGLYTLFLDSDDKFTDSKTLLHLHTCIEKNGEHDMILYSSADEYADGTFNPLPRKRMTESTNCTKEQVITSDNYPGAAWVVCIRTSLIVAHEIYFPKGYVGEDYIWIMKAMRYCSTIGICEDAFVTHYKDRPNSICNSQTSLKGIKGCDLAIQYWLSSHQDLACCKGIENIILKIYLIMILDYTDLPDKDKTEAKSIIAKDREIFKYIRGKKASLLKYSFNLLGICITARLVKSCYVMRKKAKRTCLK